MMPLTDEKLAFLELRRDPLFHLIPSDKYDYYVNEAIAFGREAGKKYKNKKIQQLYQKNDIAFSFSEKRNVVMNFQLRAEFIQKDDQNEVVLYSESLRELRQAWNDFSPNLVQLTEEDIVNLHLAHEFYHYLEYNELSPVEKRLDPVETRTFFGKKKEQYIRQCSEIACHAFAKEVTGFPYFPTLLDLVFLETNDELDSEVSIAIFG